MLPAPECVADGGSETGGIGRTEFVVVMNEVDMSLRSHKQIARHIQAKTAAKVSQKVVAGGVVLAIRSTARSNVEPRVLASYSRHQLRGHAAGNGKMGQPNGIEVIKERPVGYSKRKRLIRGLASAPGEFRADAEIVPDQEVRADARRQAPSYGLRRIAAGCVGGGGG